MVTIVKKIAYSVDEYLIEAYGLSTDTKPTVGIANGSSFVEMDKGKICFFSKASETWLEFGA